MLIILFSYIFICLPVHLYMSVCPCTFLCLYVCLSINTSYSLMIVILSITANTKCYFCQCVHYFVYMYGINCLSSFSVSSILSCHLYDHITLNILPRILTYICLYVLYSMNNL